MAFSQNDSDVYLAGYDKNNYFKYFDSLHNKQKVTIQSLNHTYKCYLVFKIDTNANLTNFELIEIPDAPLPEIAKIYVQNIFNSTNGKWVLNNKHKAFSDDLLFSVSLLKMNQSPEQRIKDFAPSFEFTIKGLQLHRRLKAYNLQNEVSITLPF